MGLIKLQTRKLNQQSKFESIKNDCDDLAIIGKFMKTITDYQKQILNNCLIKTQILSFSLLIQQSNQLMNHLQKLLNLAKHRRLIPVLSSSILFPQHPLSLLCHSLKSFKQLSFSPLRFSRLLKSAFSTLSSPPLSSYKTLSDPVQFATAEAALSYAYAQQDFKEPMFLGFWRGLMMLEDALKHQPQNIILLYQFSRLLEQETNFERANELLRRALKLMGSGWKEEDAVEINKKIWRNSLLLGNIEEAGQFEEEARKAFPSHQKFNKEREKLLRMGRDKALLSLLALQDRVDQFLSDEKPQECFQFYEQIVNSLDDVKPQNKILLLRPLLHLEQKYTKANSHQQRMRCLRKIRDIYLYHPSPRQQINTLRVEAATQTASSNYSQAIAIYDQILSLEPENQSVEFNKVECSIKGEKYAEAAQDVKRYLEKYGDESDFFFQLYELISEKSSTVNQFKEVLQEFERLFDKRGAKSNFKVIFQQTAVLRQSGKPKEAIEKLSNIISSPQTAQSIRKAALFARSGCYRDLKKYRLSISDLTTIISIFKNKLQDSDEQYPLEALSNSAIKFCNTKISYYKMFESTNKVLQKANISMVKYALKSENKELALKYVGMLKESIEQDTFCLGKEERETVQEYLQEMEKRGWNQKDEEKEEDHGKKQ